MTELTPEQLEWITSPIDGFVFMEGPAGAGKTTIGAARMQHLISQGVPADSLLVLLPQRTLATAYYEVLNDPGFAANSMVSVLTVGGLARRMVELFWPLAAEAAGFANPNQPPTFLTLETAQYYMARLVYPLFERGYFESVSISRNRIYSQILDNLNKAALVGFPYTEISPRLKTSWVGEASQIRIYDDAQDCAERFRSYCLENNLLDFSLQLEIFLKHLWPEALCRETLTGSYHHLIVDNIEEDTPVAHDLLRAWLPDFASALLIYDHEAGYRRFLGADPQSAYTLRDMCDEQVVFDGSFVSNENLEAIGTHIGLALNRSIPHPEQNEGSITPIIPIFEYHRFYPQMLDWVTEQIAHLVFDEQVPPGEIVVLAAFLPDALRFSLSERLNRLEIATRSHRPSRALREETAVHCLLTLAKLAHPHWELCPSKYDVAYALVQAISEMDLVRAQLLTEITYRSREGKPALSSFEIIQAETQARITYTLGQRYEELRSWLEAYAAEPEEELDYFLRRLFGELLSRPGYGFHPGNIYQDEILQPDYTAGNMAAALIESARKFRWAIQSIKDQDQLLEANSLGAEYIQMVEDGIVAAQYIPGWQFESEDAVLLAPAYTFLMRNRPVDYQFWLDIGSRGWFERLYQPLTHPYVLSRWWPQNTIWTDVHEHEANQETLYRLMRGLLRRCRRGIYLGLCELNEQGNEQKGPLLKAFQRILRSEISPTESPRQ